MATGRNPVAKSAHCRLARQGEHGGLQDVGRRGTANHAPSDYVVVDHAPKGIGRLHVVNALGRNAFDEVLVERGSARKVPGHVPVIEEIAEFSADEGGRGSVLGVPIRIPEGVETTVGDAVHVELGIQNGLLADVFELALPEVLLGSTKEGPVDAVHVDALGANGEEGVDVAVFFDEATNAAMPKASNAVTVKIAHAERFARRWSDIRWFSRLQNL